MTGDEAFKKAESLFKSGYTCSQAVLCTFLDELDLDEKTALKMSLMFGGGMARTREVCGCVSGMLMAASLKYASGEASDKENKDACYKIGQDLINEFKKQNGSIICRELLGLEKAENSPKSSERTFEYYKKRPCAELAGMAAKMLQEQLDS